MRRRSLVAALAALVALAGWWTRDTPTPPSPAPTAHAPSPAPSPAAEAPTPTPTAAVVDGPITDAAAPDLHGTLTVDLLFVGASEPPEYVYGVHTTTGTARAPNFTVGGLDPGRVKVRIEAYGFRYPPEFFAVEAGRTTRVSITVERGPALVGRVVDGVSRVGMPGVPLELWSPNGPRRGVTDGEGRFVFPGIPDGLHTLNVRGRALGRGYTDAAQEIQTLGTDDASLELALQHGVSLSGRVHAGGQPVADAWLHLRRLRDRTFARAQLASDGTFRVDGLGVGEHAWVVVAGTDHVQRREGRVFIRDHGAHTLDVAFDAPGGQIVALLPEQHAVTSLDLFAGHIAPASTEFGTWSLSPGIARRVTFLGLEPGPYTMAARDYDAGWKDVHVQSLQLGSDRAVVEVHVPR